MQTNMIEINLLPGSSRRVKRRFAFALPKRTRAARTGPAFDPLRLGVAACWLLGPLVIGWLMYSAGNRAAELDVAIEGARLDSTRYAMIIASNRGLQERQDVVAEKLSIVQEVDQARYVWAHVLDEASRVLPPYTWLVGLSDISVETGSKMPRISIHGRAGNTYALTQYMESLEASPFISGVTLIDHYQLREDERVLYSFLIEMNFAEAGPGAIRTVPLFASLGGD
jgi:Tfp pilus assembly protein PilN